MIREVFRIEVFNQLRFPFGLRDAKDAKTAAEKMEPTERKLLFDALRKSMADQYNEHKRLGNAVIHSDDYVRLWYIYFIPHLALGTTHSGLFIFFGEQLQGFGAQYGLSVMWAAAVGNVISNVLMLNFNKQVESLMEYLGYKRPILSAEQMHNQEVRTVSFAGKMIGMLIGSMLGLFPLLVYEHPMDQREKINKRTCTSPNYTRSFQEEAACEYVQAEEDQQRLEQKKERIQQKQMKEISPDDLLKGAPPEVDEK